jgi:3-(3-hydroxy-phenyl)propionate hydroxylase
LTTPTAEKHVDVLVIGCGPTGLALTRLLGLEGLTVAAVDPVRIPRAFPRATHLDDETMRAFQTLGLAHLEEHFSRCGLYRFYDPQWRPVMEFSFNNGVTDQGWQSDYMFHQPDFEAVLRGHAHIDPGTSHFFGWDVVDLTETGDQAHARVRERTTGQECELTASFVVGCDGANSFVRGRMGCTQDDYEATHRSLIVDILPFVRKEALAGRDSFIQGGIRNPLTFVAIAEPLVRFEELLRPDDDTAAFESLEHVYEMLSPWLRPDEYRVIRADVYEWNAVVADPWRAGRLFLAGDAAHEMPPHLGQGMASGIRDSMNLAWKLARVVRGDSPRALLDTYETERKPHMTAFVELAAQMANQIETMQPRGAQDDAEVPVTKRETLRPRLGAGVWADDDEFAGLLSAQPLLTNGQRVDDVSGYRFAVVAAQDCLAVLSVESKAALRSLNAQIIPADSDDARNWLKALNACAVVVRPDRYLFGAAATAPRLDALVARLCAVLTEESVVASSA